MEWEIKKAEIAKLVNKFEGYKNNDIDDKAILEFIEQVGEFCCKENKNTQRSKSFGIEFGNILCFIKSGQ